MNIKRQIIISGLNLFSNGRKVIGFSRVIIEKAIRQGDVLICKTSNSKWICLIDRVENEKAYYFASFNFNSETLSVNDWFRTDYINRQATENEKQILLEQIDNEGYIWDEIKLSLSEKDERTIVPECIHIYRIQTNNGFHYKCGDGLFIGSALDDKLLCINDEGYALFKNNESLFERINCRMIPCNYKDLKCGDTAFLGGRFSDIHRTSFYAKILPKGYVYLDNGSPLQSTLIDDYQWYKWIFR